ncbi:MAG: hypothetical protein V3U75_10900 [Methylococcaceae bacterium]
MKYILSPIAAFLVMTLVSCASDHSLTKSDNTEHSQDKTIQPEIEISHDRSFSPPTRIKKGEKSLRLVKAMEGGSCKNDKQGAKGLFLLYADLDDFERIKLEKGSAVFADFEKQIHAFSLTAFDSAIKSTNIAIDPFAFDPGDAQSKLSNKLAEAFKLNVNKYITAFEAETSLTIDVVAFKRFFKFYIDNCEATHTH